MIKAVEIKTGKRLNVIKSKLQPTWIDLRTGKHYLKKELLIKSL